MTLASSGQARNLNPGRTAPNFSGERRHTGGFLFVVVLGAELLLLASGVPAGDGGGTFLHATGLRLMAPLARATMSVREGIAGTGEQLKRRKTLLAENEALLAEVERLQLERTRLGSLEAEAQRLASAIGFVRSAPGKPRLADIVYLDRGSFLRSLILHSAEGRLAIDQPVLATGGLVGRIVQVAGTYARAQLITDAAAGVGAMIERNHSQGVVRGSGDGRLALDYVPHQVPIEIGDRIVTAGIDGVYPAGILIGIVAEVEPGEELFHQVRLEPAVDFSRLDHVFVIERQELPKELKTPEAGAAP